MRKGFLSSIVAAFVLLFSNTTYAQDDPSLVRFGASTMKDVTFEKTLYPNNPMWHVAVGGGDDFLALLQINLKAGQGNAALGLSTDTWLSVGAGLLLGWTRLEEKHMGNAPTDTDLHLYGGLYGSVGLNAGHFWANYRVGPIWTLNNKSYGFRANEYFSDLSAGIQFRF